MFTQIRKWLVRRPNLFAFLLVVVVVIWCVVRIGDESDKRVSDYKNTQISLSNRFNAEAKARQEIICLVLTDGVDRDKAFIDALLAASTAAPKDPTETEFDRKRREEATRIFFQKLEPSLRPIECSKFIKDPVNYLIELRKQTDVNSPSLTTTTTMLK